MLHIDVFQDDAAAELRAASAPRGAADIFCKEHTNERLALFCETCERLTCRDCQLTRHRDHKYQFSGEMATAARAGVTALLAEVAYKRALLASAARVIRDRQALIADKKRALVHDITQTVVRLTGAVNARGKQLVLRLNEVCDAKQRVLAEKKEALRQLAGVTEHAVEFAGAALERGSDTALLHAKRALCAHLQRVKARRADIPNPEIPVRIALALDNLPDLLKVLSNMGGIVVDGKVDGGAAQGPYHPPSATPPGQMGTPPGQMGTPPGQIVTHSGQMTTASGQIVTPSNQLMSASGQMMPGSNQLMSASGQMMSPSGQMMSASGQMGTPPSSHSSVVALQQVAMQQVSTRLQLVVIINI